jgi:hypothetical protein
MLIALIGRKRLGICDWKTLERIRHPHQPVRISKCGEERPHEYRYATSPYARFHKIARNPLTKYPIGQFLDIV